MEGIMISWLEPFVDTALRALKKRSAVTAIMYPGLWRGPRSSHRWGGTQAGAKRQIEWTTMHCAQIEAFAPSLPRHVISHLFDKVLLLTQAAAFRIANESLLINTCNRNNNKEGGVSFIALHGDQALRQR